MAVIIALLLVAAGILFVWRVVQLMRKFRPEAEPTAPAGDTGVREPSPRRPRGMSGAVALQEPDDDDRPTDAVSGIRI